MSTNYGKKTEFIYLKIIIQMHDANRDGQIVRKDP